MPTNGLTSGIQYKISFIDVTGVLQFSILESLTMKEDATVKKFIGIDGTVRNEKFHEGWSGACVFQRNDNLVDRYFANQEAAYYLGLDSSPITITETIQENDGSISGYQFTKCVFTLENAGEASGTDIVKQNVSIAASRRLPLS